MPDRFWSSEEYDERAHSLYNEGDYEGALETLKEGLALYPNAVELYAGLGHARLAREEYAWARVAFDRALVLDPTHEDAMVGLGEVLLRMGRSREAIELFGRVEGLGYDDDVELMLTMARALYRESLFAPGRDMFARLAAARPDCGEAVAGVGYCVHRLGDEVGACRYLRRALRIDPDLHEARTYLGHLLYDRGDWDSALRELERVPPTEQWDTLAVWRVLELKASAAGDDDLPGRAPWQERLDQLELETDPVDRILSEIEASVSPPSPWRSYDENQLELFSVTEEAGDEETVIQVRLPGGAIMRGSWRDAVRQFRDHMGFAHEPLVRFMKRMAERWHEQYGVEVPVGDPEGFLKSAARFGLLRLADPRGGRGEE